MDEDSYLDSYWEDRYEGLDDARDWEDEQVFRDHEGEQESDDENGEDADLNDYWEDQHLDGMGEE